MAVPSQNDMGTTALFILVQVFRSQTSVRPPVATENEFNHA